MADFGTLMVVANDPEGSVVGAPTCLQSKVIDTTSLAPNPVPVTWTVVVGGPWSGPRVILASASTCAAATSLGSNQCNREAEHEEGSASGRRRSIEHGELLPTI